MTPYTFTLNRHVIVALLFISAAIVLSGLLAGCGDPDPIPVYVTPTLELTATPLPQASSAQANSASGVLSGPQTVLARNDLVRQSTITPLPTPLPPPPGVTFGPITGSDYTPEPLQTPLPDVVSEQACTAQISAPQAALYASPDRSAATSGAAVYLETVQVTGFASDVAGTRWVNTANGWLMLEDGGSQIARLHDTRRCAILRGEAPDTTLLGLHVLNGTVDEPVLAFARRMAFAGKPIGTIKGLNGTETLLNQIKQVSPETVTVYRTLLHGAAEQGDCPYVDFGGGTPDAAAAARSWIAGLQPYWGLVQADYYEVVNECGWPLDFMAQFFVEAMRLANEQGRCLLLFSFSGGTPDMQSFNDLLPAYRYAVENPCANGNQHGISIHAYSMQDGMPVSQADVWVALRHRIFEERLAVTLPLAVNLPLYITELGIGGGTNFPGCEMVIDDALKYTYQLEEDPYVDGFHLWSVGSGTGWMDITECLSPLADALLGYYGK